MLNSRIDTTMYTTSVTIVCTYKTYYINMIQAANGLYEAKMNLESTHGGCCHSNRQLSVGYPVEDEGFVNTGMCSTQLWRGIRIWSIRIVDAEFNIMCICVCIFFFFDLQLSSIYIPVIIND